jgi:hypothetical protein
VHGSIRVICGPYRLARRYAERRGWVDDQFIIVTRAHQLARLDPALIKEILVVRLHALGQAIMGQIHEEIDLVRALWPVPTCEVPA